MNYGIGASVLRGAMGGIETGANLAEMSRRRARDDEDRAMRLQDRQQEQQRQVRQDARQVTLQGREDEEWGRRSQQFEAEKEDWATKRLENQVQAGIAKRKLEAQQAMEAAQRIMQDPNADPAAKAKAQRAYRKGQIATGELDAAEPYQRTEQIFKQIEDLQAKYSGANPQDRVIIGRQLDQMEDVLGGMIATWGGEDPIIPAFSGLDYDPSAVGWEYEALQAAQSDAEARAAKNKPGWFGRGDRPKYETATRDLEGIMPRLSQAAQRQAPAAPAARGSQVMTQDQFIADFTREQGRAPTPEQIEAARGKYWR